MTRMLPFLLVLFCATSGAAQDTTAVKGPMDYFNLAAKQYVKQDKMSALRTLDQGLQQHPQDARLRKLATELMKEEQQQQQQQQQDQDQNDSSKPQQGKNGQDQRKEEKPADRQQGDGSKEQQDGDQPRPGEIAPQDAKRILDALDRQEQHVQSKMRQRQQPAPKVPVDKDW